jgi:hypothetical protein
MSPEAVKQTKPAASAAWPRMLTGAPSRAARHAVVRATLALSLALLALLALAACQGGHNPQLAPGATATPIPLTLCPTCAQTEQVSALTQAVIDSSAHQAQAAATEDIQRAHALASANAGTTTQAAAMVAADVNGLALQAQAAATADIQRAQALATLNAANSTQAAALTQDSQHTSQLQAAAAGTASVLAGQALATIQAAGATQGSALTQAALAQDQAQFQARLTAQAATQSAAATGTQAWMGARVAGTATILARVLAPQTQAAEASTQQAADQRQAQTQGPLMFLLKWGLPIFIAAAAGLGLWGFGRWLKMRTTRPRAGLALKRNVSKPPRPD